MALNESFAHSMNKGHNRLIELLGTGYAFFLIAMFSQDRLLFLTFFTLFLGVCILCQATINTAIYFRSALLSAPSFLVWVDSTTRKLRSICCVTYTRNSSWRNHIFNSLSFTLASEHRATICTTC